MANWCLDVPLEPPHELVYALAQFEKRLENMLQTSEVRIIAGVLKGMAPPMATDNAKENNVVKSGLSNSNFQSPVVTQQSNGSLWTGSLSSANVEVDAGEGQHHLAHSENKHINHANSRNHSSMALHRQQSAEVRLQTSHTVDQMLGQIRHVRRSLIRPRTEKKTEIGAMILKSTESLQDRFQSFIRSTRFNLVVSTLIVCNVVVVALEVDWQARHIGAAKPTLFNLIETGFCMIFLMELALRMMVEGRKFFTDQDWRWNVFDLIMIMLGVVQMCLVHFVLVLLPSSYIVLVTWLKALRMLRVVRLVRVVQAITFFRELRLVWYGIIHSIISLMWLIIMVLFLMFFTTMFITHAVSKQLTLEKEGNLVIDKDDLESLREHFANMPRTFYSLLMAISNGEDWGILAAPLWRVSPVLGYLFIIYVCFVVFAVLNVVTGVFVDNARKASEKDTVHAMLEETNDRQKHIQDVVDIFKEADKDGSGELTFDEFEKYISNPCIQAYFRKLKLNYEGTTARKLFNLLDFDGGGAIDINEFVVGCTKLRGNARAIDVAMLQHEMRKHAKMLLQLQDSMLESERRILHLIVASKDMERLDCELPTVPEDSPYRLVPPSGIETLS
eukprot:gnl/MRDRNA2_/MRDRNA2_70263_c0_seq1.p1 gnl/MRDRNA2_/MRDRNA2_70263_c0~~gnl/MRDRNA2_/MRDRNA2_70263_c0_seq1.p1  ORF type:complete len:615 (+),score=115.77 gnl/MRDRNA2_/MRDRNA2_70263_c0_seq1:81-1925(+)